MCPLIDRCVFCAIDIGNEARKSVVGSCWRYDMKTEKEKNKPKKPGKCLGDQRVKGGGVGGMKLSRGG